MKRAQYILVALAGMFMACGPSAEDIERIKNEAKEAAIEEMTLRAAEAEKERVAEAEKKRIQAEKKRAADAELAAIIDSVNYYDAQADEVRRRLDMIRAERTSIAEGRAFNGLRQCSVRPRSFSLQVTGKKRTA